MKQSKTEKNDGMELPEELKDRQLSEIVEPLLQWYDLHARVLPWREEPTPYRVWISEIMLQQTRVEAVKPYFERFLAALPDVTALAEAPETRLLKLWEGLGYYNRVRNLQKAARRIVGEFGGRFPADFEQLLSLPGIGEYTAGAIASISFGQPVPAVDGNVLRVVARLSGSRADVADPAVRRAFGRALQAVYPAGRCGDFTQSLMELGAIVCLPNGMPKCESCPLSSCCTARRDGSFAELPVKPAKKARKIEARTVFILRCGDRIALRRRPKTGLLAGLWELPSAAGTLTPEAAAAQLRKWRLAAGPLRPAAGGKHIFTHLEWHMTGYIAECRSPSAGFEWTDRRRLTEEISLPSAFKAFAGSLFG